MQSPEIIGRYALYGKIASGGMATVHIGRLLGPVGFSRTVAIKRMHPQFTSDPEFVSMFLDEARLAARVRHPNVVSTLDVVATNGELFLVLDYVQGETLSTLVRRCIATGEGIPVPIVTAILSGVLHGLHAAHEAKNEQGEPLGIVHRDISPQNVMVGIDGVSRVLDFGVAKAAGRLQTTESGKLKGKLAYMPPEQIRGKAITRRCDVYAAAVVLWEALSGQRLFRADNEAFLLQSILNAPIDPPSAYRPEISPELDAVVMRGLERDPDARFATAREMATALEAAGPVAIGPAVGAWVDGTAADTLSAQAARIAAIESASDVSGANSAVDAQAFVDIASSNDKRVPVAIAADELPTVASTDASASRASVLSVSSSGALPASHGRRNVLVAAVSTVIAVSVTVLAMQHQTGAPPVAGSLSGVSAPSAEPPVVALPPPTGVAAALAPPAVAPGPSAEPSTTAAPSTPPPVAAPPPAKVPAPAWKPPVKSTGAAARPGAPPASGNPGYNPLDHL